MAFVPPFGPRLASLVALATALSAHTVARAEDAPSPSPSEHAPEHGTVGITMPRVLTQVGPDVSTVPESARITGTVLLCATIDAAGTVSKVEVVQSLAAPFDEAASKALAQWTFAPATKDGVSIAAKIHVPIRFAPSAEAPPSTPSAAAEAPVVLTPPVVPTPPVAGPIAPVVPAPSLALSAPPPVTAEASPKSAPEPDASEVVVVGRAQTPSRGASDIHVELGELSAVPRKNASELLTLAPGVFLSREGGDGHAERVYLRGFDAREGQDIAFSVGGVPINESGNLHGSGFADTHFVIPELVSSLRVLEGPFDPRQGNYAVAGSADYELGLEKRGLTASYTMGSFGAQRLLFLWGPPGESAHTFGGAEIATTNGFGQNRDARRASAMGQYEGQIGVKGTWRLSGAAYVNEYHSAGLLRADDVAAGRKGFFDTYDTRQGGGGSRFQVSGDVETRSGAFLLQQQIFAIAREMRLRENFTGYLLDTQLPTQALHGQRGDLFDLAMNESTFGARGAARTQGEAFGQKQEVELGYFARLDRVAATRQRIEAATGVPYKTDTDLASNLGDLGLYGDATLRPLAWLALRGGVRGDVFTYDVLDSCAVQSVSRPSSTSPPGDASCLDQQRFGRHREPDQRSSTSSLKLMPRASVIAGPFRSVTFSGSVGTGVRSIDPSYVTQDVATPFASILAYEAGASYAGAIRDVRVGARAVLFGTHVDRDLVFSESAGRAILGGGTTRAGGFGSVRATGDAFDENLTVTVVRSRFDDTGLLVPYVPDLVLRSDSAVFGELPLSLAGAHPLGRVGAGVSYIGRRALPYDQQSDVLFTVDGNAGVSYRAYDLSLAVTNVLDARQRIAEFAYVSDFHSAASPTLVPARHFAAGAPRSVFLTFSVTIGGS